MLPFSFLSVESEIHNRPLRHHVVVVDVDEGFQVTALQYALPISNGESLMPEILSCPDIVRFMNDIATAEHLLNQLKVQTPLLLTPTRL